MHKWRILTGFTLNQPKTSSRAAKRRGDPEPLDCFVANAPRNDGLCKGLSREGGASSTLCLKNEKIIFSSEPHRTSILGPASGWTSPATAYTRMFRCRKKGFDYLGQVQIQKAGPKLCVEIFNENYFSHFEGEKNEVLDALETVILRRLVSGSDFPSGYKTLILSFLEAKIRSSVEQFPTKEGEPCTSSISPHPQPVTQQVLPRGEKELSSSPPLEERIEVRRNEKGFDLQEIFDRLNAEYFENKIRAGVGWGRDSKKKNRSAFRFGSYDRAKRLIRIHPRLNQEFVPHSVVELTVYHEMCHQWAPSVKRNGVWRDHHADFKKKEKEYRFYQEARSWEKQNWKKFLNPIEEKTSL